jgi:hypothetical protein
MIIPLIMYYINRTFSTILSNCVITSTGLTDYIYFHCHHGFTSTTYMQLCHDYYQIGK